MECVAVMFSPNLMRWTVAVRVMVMVMVNTKRTRRVQRLHHQFVEIRLVVEERL